MREDVEYYFICLGFSILMVESLKFSFLVGNWVCIGAFQEECLLLLALICRPFVCLLFLFKLI